ncbi:MAG: MOSC N-terminal beta barrel domain-containing protein [Chitinophagaceae bacterium]
MLQISRLFVYPIKSLGGISVPSALLTDRGFQYDRRWMLVDEQNQFMTQREYPQMALLQTDITSEGISIFHKNDIHERILVPFWCPSDIKLTVQVWDDYCEAVFVSREIDQWLSKRLDVTCRLVFMPDDSLRKVDPKYAVRENNYTSLSDGYPILLLSQSSLDDLNSRLDKPLPMNRFRPNMVIMGANPYEEDEMADFMIRGVHFYGVKLCGRCVMTTINQESLEKGKEPLKTLSTYRQKENSIKFGQNVIYSTTGISLKTGDRIEIIQRKAKLDFGL